MRSFESLGPASLAIGGRDEFVGVWGRSSTTGLLSGFHMHRAICKSTIVVAYNDVDWEAPPDVSKSLLPNEFTFNLLSAVMQTGPSSAG